ncbi:limbin [Eublepharis macularius]|uniref:Limbin n=1 Tax=Eublepharis macularius TaxID=481883 RepID=A0AA97LHJ1_EUBMA|nr:limbin [Eublepharis macularius]
MRPPARRGACPGAASGLGVALLLLAAAAPSCFGQGLGEGRPRREPRGRPGRGLVRPLPPFLGANFSPALGTERVAQDVFRIQTSRKCFSTTAVKMPEIQGQNEDHKLLLTSAGPDIHSNHSSFASVSFWTKKFKRQVSVNHQTRQDVSRIAVSSAHGIIFQKCAVVGTDHEPERAYVKLLINNTSAPHALNVTDLVLLDNITGLHVQGTKGNQTADGFQTFRIQFLHVGDHYLLEYIAIVNAKESGNAGVLILPAKLTFRSPLNNSEFDSLTASLRIIGEKKTKILLSHSTHGMGFFAAFIISFVLTSVMLWTAYKTRRILRERQEAEQDPNTEYKKEHSYFKSGGTNHEDILLNDHIIDILFFEEPENMLQSLEDFEIANLTHADRDLEARRMQISQEVIALLMKNTIATYGLSPHVEKRVNSAFRKQFLTMEVEIQEEYKRKMVALTAECSLENRKAAESQHHREKGRSREAEELVKKASEKSAAECRALMEKLHRLEQLHGKRFLLVKQDEYFAVTYRELAFSERNEIHKIFFTQMRNMICKGELKLEAAKSLAENYSKMQEDVEERMDFLQAHKKYHLSKRFAHREYLIQLIQLLDPQMPSLWDIVANQIAVFISKVERSCHFPENHLGGVLNRAQAELHSAQEKFAHFVKEEKQKLHQELLAKRRQEMLHKKEEQQAQTCPEKASRGLEDVCCYVAQWLRMLVDHSAEFEELVEKLDNEVKEELLVLRYRLTKRASEEIRRIHYGSVIQELLNLSVPKLYLNQSMEEHQRELAEATQRLEKEDQGKIMAAEKLLQSKREKLSEELLNSMREQRKLRSCEQLVLSKLLGASLSLSEEEVLQIKQEVHGCFSQMDSCLALPKIRARVLLQVYQSEWREAALREVDRKRHSPSGQQETEAGSKTRTKNKIDVLKKSLETKIHIYEESITEQYENKILSELQLERVHQLQALESKIGERITSLQFQRTSKIPETLELYMAVVQLRSLLLEELSTSKTLTNFDCAEITARSNHEMEELEKKMEGELLHQELAQPQPYLMNRRRQNPDQPGIANSLEELHSDGPVPALLQQALTKGEQLVCLHRQSLRDVQNNLAVLENFLETIEMDTLLAVYTKELRLVSHLTKLTQVPAGTLRRLVHLLLPTQPQNELLSVLGLTANKHSEAIPERESSGEEAGNCPKKKHQQSWRTLEMKLRQEVISANLGRMNSVICDNSVLKRKQLALLEKATFFHPECLPEPLHPVDAAGAAEIIMLSDTNEKIFVFRDSAFSTDTSSTKKKKTSFLNSKKLGLIKTEK